MPVHPVNKKGCYQWGHKGKVYCGPGAKKKASIQGSAIRRAGWKGK